jgi:hypothetical protein
MLSGMSTPQQVKIPDATIERAAQLAEAMTAQEDSDNEWTVQDVINVALGRGLDAMEQLYPKSAK